MGRRDCARELLKDRYLHFLEFNRLNNIQDFLELIQEHDFFWRVYFGPESKKTHYNLVKKGKMRNDQQ